MAVYQYTNVKTWDTIERNYPIGKAPKTVCLRNGVYSLNAYHRGTETQKPSCWPMTSEACGVHPKQVNELREYCRRRGLPGTVNKDGTITFSSRGERKKHCEGRGFYDMSGGYGDPQKRRSHGSDDGIID